MSEFKPYLPFKTLLLKEIKRFLAVASQTLLGPVVSSSLYLLIFGMGIGSRLSIHPEHSYAQFIIPGLVLMGVVNNAFANTSSSLFMSRYLGNIVDILVTPIRPSEFIAAYTLAAMFRGMLVGLVTYLVTIIFAPVPWANPLQAIGIALLASFVFAQFGILAAIFSSSFDTLSMFTNFLILPLIYLGGLFYPVADLPEPWRTLSQFNPLYYIIEGFRVAVLGHGSLSLTRVWVVTGTMGLVLFILAAAMVATGYKLRK